MKNNGLEGKKGVTSKSKFWDKYTIIGAILGAILFTVMFIPMQLLELKICPMEEVLTSKNAPGCINHDGELQGTGGWYCREGNIYQEVNTYCITDKLYFLVNPIIRDLHSDAYGVALWLLLLYGALVGVLITKIIMFVSYNLKNRK